MNRRELCTAELTQRRIAIVNTTANRAPWWPLLSLPSRRLRHIERSGTLAAAPQTSGELPPANSAPFLQVCGLRSRHEVQASACAASADDVATSGHSEVRRGPTASSSGLRSDGAPLHVQRGKARAPATQGRGRAAVARTPGAHFGQRKDHNGPKSCAGHAPAVMLKIVFTVANRVLALASY